MPPFRPDARLHSIFVQTRSFGEVHDVELDPLHLLLCPEGHVLVDHLKVKPLRVTASVCIILEPQVILDVVQLGGFAQVPIFKSGIEYQYVLVVGHILLSVQIRVVSLLREPRHMSVYHPLVGAIEFTRLCRLVQSATLTQLLDVFFRKK